MTRAISLLLPTLAVLLAGCANPAPETTQTLPALDLLQAENAASLQGMRVGVVTNHTAVTQDGVHLVDILHEAPEVTVGAIFAPEHGFRGNEEGGYTVDNLVDEVTGAPIYSLYGETRKPTPEMMEDLDILVFDIQDIGARFYTYISTMGYVMEAGTEHNVPVMILDRPNPIGGQAKGPMLDMAVQSFVGRFPIPIQHGLTVGELAQMIKGEGWIPQSETLDLRVMTASGWTRDQFWPALGLRWIDPSPNMRNFTEAMTYPGLCLIEGTNLNEGRGTEMPFEIFGAPWVDSAALAAALVESGVKGFTVSDTSFVPVSMPGYAANPKFQDETVHGVRIRITDPATFDAVAFGVHMLSFMKTQYPDQFDWSSAGRIDRLWGGSGLREALDAGTAPAEIIAGYQAALEAFKAQREPYLLYP